MKKTKPMLVKQEVAPTELRARLQHATREFFETVPETVALLRNTIEGEIDPAIITEAEDPMDLCISIALKIRPGAIAICYARNLEEAGERVKAIVSSLKNNGLPQDN